MFMFQFQFGTIGRTTNPDFVASWAEFQFQFGTIGRLKPKNNLRYPQCFNSRLVRLVV